MGSRSAYFHPLVSPADNHVGTDHDKKSFSLLCYCNNYKCDNNAFLTGQ